MRLCLGTVQFGMDYGIQGQGRPSETLVDAMLAYAFNHGINCLDTASAYGNAEDVIGHFIKKNKEKFDKIRIVSKMPSDSLENISDKVWAEMILHQAEHSITNLGIDKLYAYLFHHAGYIFEEKAVEALMSVADRGLAEKIGVSVYSPEEAMKALEYNEIKVIQIPYNVFDQRLDQCGFFQKAKKRGVEIYARSTLLQGLIMMEPDKLPERMKFASRYLKHFLNICSEYNTSPLLAAVGYVGASPYIDYMVFGVDNKDQLTEYISMQKEYIPEKMICDLRTAFKEVDEKLVNPVLWK